MTCHPNILRLYEALYSPPMLEAEKHIFDQQIAKKRAEDDRKREPSPQLDLDGAA